MDENTNLNETNESNSAENRVYGEPTEEKQETVASAFSMPTDPMSEEKAEETSSETVSEAAPAETSDSAIVPLSTGEVVTNTTVDATNESIYSEPADSYASAEYKPSNPYSPTAQTVSGSVEGSTSSSDEPKGYAIASLVLGILSILSVCCCALLGVILGIVGIVMSNLQQPNSMTGEKPGLAKAGLICSIVGIVICLISSAAGIILALQ